MPDLDLATGDGEIGLYSLLHKAQPVLIGFVDGARLDAGPWADRVRVVRAGYDGPWELPVIGAVRAPSSVLGRPDGYVAWVGESAEDAPTEALRFWFGETR